MVKARFKTINEEGYNSILTDYQSRYCMFSELSPYSEYNVF